MPDKPDIVLKPPLAALGALAICIVGQALLPASWLNIVPPDIAAFLGPFFLVIGFGIAGTAILAFRRAQTNIEPSKPALAVVHSGPYRFTRNPMYIGLLSVHLGLGIILSLDWALVVTIALWVFLHFGVVLREETYLSNKFGPEYHALLRSTRRWF